MPVFTQAEKTTLYAESLFLFVILNLILLGVQFVFFPLFWVWIWTFQLVVNLIILYVLVRKTTLPKTKSWWELINRRK